MRRIRRGAAEHLLRVVDPVDDTCRRQMNRQLTVQESRHKLARDVCHGKRGTIGLRRSGRKLEVLHAAGSWIGPGHHRALHTRSAVSTPQAGGIVQSVKKASRLGDVAYASGSVKNIEFGQHPGQPRQARAASSQHVCTTRWPADSVVSGVDQVVPGDVIAHQGLEFGRAAGVSCGSSWCQS
ncbi:transposase [Streptomyces nojiriensis]